MQDQTQLFVKMGVDSWNGCVGRFNKVLDSLSDEQLMQEAAPAATGAYTCWDTWQQ